MLSAHFAIDALWSLIGAIWIFKAGDVKPTTTNQSPATRLAQSGLLAIAAILMFFQWPRIEPLQQRVFPSSATLTTIGFVAAVAGFVLAIFARTSLGGNWSGSATIKQDHELIRSGPYSIVRHPMYFGLLIAAIGTAVIFGHARQLLALPILLIAFRMKQLNEERLLLQVFGEQYREYRQTVRWAMIPFIL